MASVMRLASTASPAFSGTAIIAHDRPQSAKATKLVAAPRAVATSPSQTPTTATTGSVSDCVAAAETPIVIDDHNFSSQRDLLQPSAHLAPGAIRAVLLGQGSCASCCRWSYQAHPFRVMVETLRV